MEGISPTGTSAGSVSEPTDEELLATPVGFCFEILGLNPYDWQCRFLTWLEAPLGQRTKLTVATPNGAGKDTVLIATAALWWVSVHKRGKVVIMSKDSRQLDEQTYAALSKHRSKFEGWKWIDRYIETPTGGRIILFTTDDVGRVEGYHHDKLPDGSPDPDGPLLIIVNEAKSIPDPILTGIDRCTYDVLAYASSPGIMTGAFWDSHNDEKLGFKRMQIGLADCPHKDESITRDIIAKYGPRHPFTRSTLYGEFQLDGANSRFDFTGLEVLQRIATSHHNNGHRGIISENNGKFSFQPHESGWVWMSEHPQEGRAYCGIADPMSGEESTSTKKKDTHGAGILRQDYIDKEGVYHHGELVGAIYVEAPEEFSGAACRWELSVLAYRMWLLTGYFGHCMLVPEENNYGTAFIKECLDLGIAVWQRQADDLSGRVLKSYGFKTTSKTKRFWVEALAKVIFEQSFICRFKPAVAQLAAFVQNPDGSCEARTGAFDDFVAAIGIGLVTNAYTVYRPRVKQLGYANPNLTVRNKAAG